LLAFNKSAQIYNLMKIFKSIKDLQAELKLWKARKMTIGFVPTMGALHKGHLSLIEKSRIENNITVVSIFVNPTQFNNPNDLKKYPRTIENDSLLLRQVNTDILFFPSVQEIYPKPTTQKFDFGHLDKVMEGKFRAGHFDGVAQVVSRLFDIVRPDNSYFGQKDFQQLAIIKAMVKILKLSVKIHACPIVRETDGLAMSSRNQRLSESERKNAVTISQVLFESKEFAKTHSPTETNKWVIGKINSNPILKLEYFEIVDELNLQKINSWNEKNNKVGCIAVFLGHVRLIDNIVY